MLETRQIYFNSCNATYYHNGDFHSNLSFYFKEAIYMPPYVDVYVSIDSCVIPISFYIINEYNNILKIQNSDNSITTFTFTYGNYTCSQFVKYLNTVLTGYIITFSSITNKITIVKSNNTNFTLLTSSTCLSVIGFNKKTSHTSVSYSLTSDQVVDFSGNNQILIEIGNLTTRNLDSKTGSFSQVFLNIPISVSNGNILIWSNYNQYKTLVYNKYFNQFNIRILDEDYNEIDFNGKDWSIVLTLNFEENLDKKQKYQALQNLIARIPEEV